MLLLYFCCSVDIHCKSWRRGSWTWQHERLPSAPDSSCLETLTRCFTLGRNEGNNGRACNASMHLQYGDLIYHRLNALSVRNTGGAMIEATLSSWFWFNPSIFGSWVALGSTGGGTLPLNITDPSRSVEGLSTLNFPLLMLRLLPLKKISAPYKSLRPFPLTVVGLGMSLSIGFYINLRN